MAKNLLIDFNNLVSRSFFAVNEFDPDTRREYIYQSIFYSLNLIIQKFSPCELHVFADSKSWRKTISDTYKINRATIFADRPEDKVLYENILRKLSDLFPKIVKNFYQTKNAETDDLVSIFIEQHPDDTNIIVSTDNDFNQLMNNNVQIYNPVTKRTVCMDRVLDENNNILDFRIDSNGKISVSGKGTPINEVDNWPEFALFVKTIRGDASDNIFSAYPGVRMESKTRPCILSAFKARKTKDYDWLNFMQQKWTDHEGQERLVEDCYNMNDRLINLKHIDEPYKSEFEKYIKEYQPNEDSKRNRMMVLNRFVILENLSRMETEINNYLDTLIN